MPRRALLCCCLLLVAGCAEFDTTYGRTDAESESVNGLRILVSRWRERFPTRNGFRLTDRLQDRADLLLYIDRLRRAEPIDDDAAEWIDDWFAAGDQQRQLIILLRNGELGAWLCRRWAAEIDGVLSELDAEERALREELLLRARDALLERAREEHVNPTPAIGSDRELPWVRITGRHPVTAVQAMGPCGDGLPPYLELRTTVHARGGTDAADLQPLIQVDDQVLAVEITRPGGRIIVVTDTTPFLDAGLVHPGARRMLECLIDRVAAWEPEESYIVGSLSVRQGDPQPPNILGMLFAKAPFNIILLHIFTLLLAWVWFRGAWLGRVNPLTHRELEHFGKHVDTLGHRLRRQRVVDRCLKEFATWFGRPAPERLGDDIDSALARADGLFRRPGDASTDPRTAKDRS